MSILVTGATGFIGRHLCEALLRRGDTVVALEHDRAFHYPVRFDGYAPYEQRLILVRGDVQNYDMLIRVVLRYQVECVVHLAAETQVGVASLIQEDARATIIGGTKNVLRACVAAGVKRCIVASTDKVYGECYGAKENSPLNPNRDCTYSMAKLEADLLCTRFRWNPVEVVVTRCGNIYGPGDTQWRRLIPDAIRCAITEKKLLLRTDGSEVRDWLYIADAIAAYLKLIDSKETGVFNFSGGDPRDTVSIIRSINGFLSSYKRPLLACKAGSSIELQRQVLCCDKANEVLDWRPVVAFSGGISWAYDWYHNWLTGARPRQPLQVDGAQETLSFSPMGMAYQGVP